MVVVNKGKEIIIKPIKKKKLSKILEKINEQNLHEEIETGSPVGNEIW